MADRILVYGVTGSGKTSIAERISTATTIPWYSVDDLTWEPGWTPVAEDVQRRRIAAICAGCSPPITSSDIPERSGSPARLLETDEARACRRDRECGAVGKPAARRAVAGLAES